MDTPAQPPRHIAVGEINELRAQGVLPMFNPGDWSGNAQVRQDLPNSFSRTSECMDEKASESIATVHYWFLSIIQEADEATQAIVYRALALAQRNTLAENLFTEASELDDPNRTDEDREKLMEIQLHLSATPNEVDRADWRLTNELLSRRFRWR